MFKEVVYNRWIGLVDWTSGPVFIRNTGLETSKHDMSSGNS